MPKFVDAGGISDFFAAATSLGFLIHISVQKDMLRGISIFNLSQLGIEWPGIFASLASSIICAAFALVAMIMKCMCSTKVTMIKCALVMDVFALIFSVCMWSLMAPICDTFGFGVCSKISGWVGA